MRFSDICHFLPLSLGVVKSAVKIFYLTLEKWLCYAGFGSSIFAVFTDFTDILLITFFPGSS